MSLKEIFDTHLSILQQIEIPDLLKRGIKLYVKRDDLIHSEVSGNKWRKLKYNIEQICQGKYEGVFTFGGAFSNHLLATASACHQLGLKSIGFVRGDELNVNSNNTLKRCHSLGMDVRFLPREEYTLRNDKEYIHELQSENTGYFLVPEGGANYLGVIGCQEIVKEIDIPIDHLFVAQGTTTTSCGILIGKNENTKLHVVPVLKGFHSRETMHEILKYALLDEEYASELISEVIVHSEDHFGGYGKYTDELVQFIHEMYHTYQIPLDFVYTGKAFYAMLKELLNGRYDNQTVVFVHTGGLQGNGEVVKFE
jgi:1-aminocyclopropane-1-carboxylate deaminase